MYNLKNVARVLLSKKLNYSPSRYIEELNREAGEDAVLGAVFHAVETCFVGKKFVFRIKVTVLLGINLLGNVQFKHDIIFVAGQAPGCAWSGFCFKLWAST